MLSKTPCHSVRLLGSALSAARREKTPLPIAWADAALGNLSGSLRPRPDSEAKAVAGPRGIVEHYFENLWIHQPRLALGGLSPLEAPRAASSGRDLVAARVKLAAVVRYREQLGTRPTHLALYQGYPFDRLRRRLELLEPAASAALEAGDFSCMSPRELDALDPAALAPQQLAEAFLSSASLRDDAITSRFAAPLARLARSGLEQAEVVAPLIREALRLGDPEEALDWLKTARARASVAQARTLTVWSAEIQARCGAPEAALRAYRDLLDRPDSDAALALDGAETLLDNGYPDHALPLILEARSRAQRSGDRAIVSRTEFLLGSRRS